MYLNILDTIDMFMSKETLKTLYAYKEHLENFLKRFVQRMI